MSSESRPRTVYLGDHRVLTRTAHGHAIFVDTRDLRDGPQLLLDGAAQPSCAEALRRIVQPGMTVVEIGAGFGELTLLSGELVGERGRVVAFERDPGTLQLLTDSIETNGQSARVRVESSAVLDEAADNADGSTTVRLDEYLTAAAITPDVILLGAGVESKRALVGAGDLIARAADIRIVLATSPNGEAALLEAAGLVTLEAGAGSTVYGPPEALPAPVQPITVLSFADELFQFPDLLSAFTSTYSGKPATLVVLGIDWEQHALDVRLDALGAPAQLSRQGLDLVAVAAPSGGAAEQDLAELVGVVFTHRPLPDAFRYAMRVDPPAGGQLRRTVLSPDPVGPPLPLYEELPGRQRSRLCNEEQLLTEDYAFWCSEFGQQPARHRKQWEYVFICKVLHERGLLAPGRRGIGFGVGSEPLPALFARYGSEVVATDLGLDEAVAAGWQTGNQHARGIDQLNKLGLCPPEEFRRRVSFRVEDMNAISPDLHGGFDFTWSSCCFEHLGSIEHGLRFVEESLKLLKPGGIAVHTTEFNLSSNDDTVFEGGCVIFRRRDIDRLAQRVTADGHRICLDYTEGTLPGDLHVDVPPYTQSPHLRLLLQGFVSTSIGLVVQKAPA